MDVWCSAEATEAHYRDGTSPGDGTEASPFSLIEALTASDIHGSEFDRNGSTYVFHPQEATAGWA